MLSRRDSGFHSSTTSEFHQKGRSREGSVFLLLTAPYMSRTKQIMIVYGYAEANRTVHMDKPKPEPAPIDSWMGRSHGRWEGDTLVVDAAGFNGEAWLDRVISSRALSSFP